MGKDVSRGACSLVRGYIPCFASHLSRPGPLGCALDGAGIDGLLSRQRQAADRQHDRMQVGARYMGRLADILHLCEGGDSGRYCDLQYAAFSIISSALHNEYGMGVSGWVSVPSFPCYFRISAQVKLKEYPETRRNQPAKKREQRLAFVISWPCRCIWKSLTYSASGASFSRSLGGCEYQIPPAEWSHWQSRGEQSLGKLNLPGIVPVCTHNHDVTLLRRTSDHCTCLLKPRVLRVSLRAPSAGVSRQLPLAQHRDAQAGPGPGDLRS